MITGFNPAVSNNRNQRQNFCAVNPKFYQKAEQAVKDKNGYTFVVRDLQEAFAGKDISHQDTMDTLDAIKQIFPPNFKNIIDETKEDIAEYLKRK